MINIDKTKDFADIHTELENDISRIGIALKELRDELFQSLEDQKNEVVPQTTPHEVLRSYIQTSRKIQKTLFDEVSTHVLTIERLADHILCRRAAILRDTKSKKSVPAPKTGSTVTTVVEGLFSKFEEATKGLNDEQKLEFLRKIRGG